MGVELHIVRRNDFDNDEEESNISLDDWKALVENDPELTWKQYAHSDDETDYSYCYWLKHPEQDESNRPWFYYAYGTVSTKWIFSPCFEKLNEMATKLGGRLEGDEGPLSEADIKYLMTPQPTQEFENISIPRKKPFWKFW